MESPQEKGTETLNASVISLLLPQAGAFCFREDAGIGELECFEKDAALGGRPEFVRLAWYPSGSDEGCEEVSRPTPA